MNNAEYTAQRIVEMLDHEGKCPANERSVDDALEIVKIVRALGNTINSYSNFDFESEVFFRALECEHRTLQQSFWRLMQRVIKLIAEKGTTDLRNEATKKWCQKVADIEWYLPLV